MFKRLSNSLLSPKEVAKYYHESFGRTLLMILILIIFMMVPIVTVLSNSNFLTYQTKEDIKAAFVNEEIPFKIENGKLINVHGENDTVYINKNVKPYIIVFTEKLQNYNEITDTITLVFCDDGVYAKMAVASAKFVTFSDHQYFNNIDFSNKEIFKDFVFWNNTFSVLQNLIDESKPTYVIMYTIYNLFYSVFWIGLLCLIISFFSKMRLMGALKFWDIFKVSVYSLTPAVICSVFASLFNIGILIYIGFIISAIYNSITINEVLKNTYSVRREGE